MDLILQVAINRTSIETADPFASLKSKPQTFPTYKEVESSPDSPGRRFQLVNQETVKEQRKADYKSGMISTPVAVIGSIILGALILGATAALGFEDLAVQFGILLVLGVIIGIGKILLSLVPPTSPPEFLQIQGNRMFFLSKKLAVKYDFGFNQVKGIRSIDVEGTKYLYFVLGEGSSEHLVGESPVFVFSKAAESFFKEVINTAHNL